MLQGSSAPGYTVSRSPDDAVNAVKHDGGTFSGYVLLYM